VNPEDAPPVLFQVTTHLGEREWGGSSNGGVIRQGETYVIDPTASGSSTDRYVAQYHDPATGGSYSERSAFVSAGEAVTSHELFLQWFQEPIRWLSWPGVTFDTSVTAWVRGGPGTMYGGEVDLVSADLSPIANGVSFSTGSLHGDMLLSGFSNGNTIEVNGVLYSQAYTVRNHWDINQNAGDRHNPQVYGGIFDHETVFRVFIDEGLAPEAVVDGVTEVALGETMFLDGSESFDRDDLPFPVTADNNGIVQYRWYHDVGTERILIGESSTLSHEWRQMGEQTVVLEVVDNEGMRAETTVVVQVGPHQDIEVQSVSFRANTNDEPIPSNTAIPVNVTFSLHTTIVNQNLDDIAIFQIRFVISENDYIGDADDLVLLEQVETLDPGEKAEFIYHNIRLPGTGVLETTHVVDEAPYPELWRFGGPGNYIGVVADPENVIPELNEDNNSQVQAVQIWDPVYTSEHDAVDFDTREEVDKYYRSTYESIVFYDRGLSKDWTVSRFSFYTGQVMPPAFFRTQVHRAELNPLTGRWVGVVQGPEPNPRFVVEGFEFVWNRELFNYVHDYHNYTS